VYPGNDDDNSSHVKKREKKEHTDANANKTNGRGGDSRRVYAER
jgi:hypothetical protein